jgi:hypothetical protein
MPHTHLVKVILPCLATHSDHLQPAIANEVRALANYRGTQYSL